MQDRTSINGDICVALDDTCLLNGLSFRHHTGVFCTEAAAVDVAIDSGTLSFRSDGAAVKHDICVTGYACQLTTAIDRFLDGNHMTFDIVTNRDVRISCNHGGQTETTTKDIFMNSAVDDIYSRIVFLIFCCCIFSLVTAAIDVVVDSTAIDSDIDCVLRSPIEIVTTKDVVDNSICCTALLHRHGNRTIDISSDSFRNRIRCCPLSFTATIEVTCDGTAIEVYMSRLVCSIGICRTCRLTALRGIHFTHSATAIDITCDIGITDVVVSRSLTGISTYIDCYIACHSSALTEAATKDVASNVDAQILIGLSNIKCCITINICRIAATVYTGSNCSTLICSRTKVIFSAYNIYANLIRSCCCADIHQCITRHISFTATAKDLANLT